VTPLLELDGFTTGYGRRPVVWEVSLTVGAGEVVALLGANGAGKTTTLLGISGLLPTLGGSARVLGRETESFRRAHRLVGRGLAHVPQDRALFPKLTVMQHLRLAHGYSDAALQRVLELFPQLVGLRQRRVGLLSGGEQQMVAMARGLISDPAVLVIDEMSQGLAPLVVEELFGTVRELASQQGVGVLLVEQHVDKALAMADHAAVLTHGRVSLAGSPEEILQSRETLEASYLGRDEVDAGIAAG
jgi:branched-chain amino acid transport system ATP-binding protein